MLTTRPGGRCVYVAPLAQIADEMLATWRRRFGPLGIGIESLTGETATDLKLLEKSTILVSTPQRWDLISRRWKQRKNVQTVSLLVVDELHLIGGEPGPVLEVVISRMRYISSQTESACGRRPLHLASQRQGPRRVDWLHAARHVQLPRTCARCRSSCTSRASTSRMRRRGCSRWPSPATMRSSITPRAACDRLRPSAKQAQLTAVDLLTYASADNAPNRFMHATADDLAPFLAKIKSKALEHTLAYGIGFLHRLRDEEQKAVKALRASGAIPMLVVVHSMAWPRAAGAPSSSPTRSSTTAPSTGTSTTRSPTCCRWWAHAAPRRRPETVRAAVPLAKKPFLRKFYEPLPVESHLDHFLADHMCAETVTKTIESKQMQSTT